MSREGITIDIDDTALDELLAKFDEAISKKAMLPTTGIGEGGESLEMLRDDIDEIKMKADIVTVQSLAKLESVEDLAEAVEFNVDATVDRISQEIIITDNLRLDLERTALELPAIDRASRMILLRIPGLREAMRLLYVIKMQQRTLKLGEIRGPITFAITMAMYGYMFLQSLLQRQDQMDARIRSVERDMDIRLISLEEALRGYGNIPERYRGGISQV